MSNSEAWVFEWTGADGKTRVSRRMSHDLAKAWADDANASSRRQNLGIHHTLRRATAEEMKTLEAVT